MPEVVPCQGPLGARIEGLDRSRANEPETATLLNRALAEHLLVVVPGERMTPSQTLAFAKAFGTPRTQLLRYKHSGNAPEVSVMVSTLMADGTTDKTAIRAEDWHTDDSYFAVPAKATLLHGIEIPSRGGSTWFCNMHSVYEALPATARQRIDGMRADFSATPVTGEFAKTKRRYCDQRGHQERRAQGEQRKPDRDVGGNIITRDIGHLVHLAEENRPNMIVKVAE